MQAKREPRRSWDELLLRSTLPYVIILSLFWSCKSDVFGGVIPPSKDDHLGF